MRTWLIIISEPVIVAIDAIALLLIVVGTAEVLTKSVHAAIRPLGDRAFRTVWLGYARWLVAALTLQLAADILETSISTSWEAIGRLGAIAVIRTFLNYFLERDVEQQGREGEIHAAAGEPSPPSAHEGAEGSSRPLPTALRGESK